MELKVLTQLLEEVKITKNTSQKFDLIHNFFRKFKDGLEKSLPTEIQQTKLYSVLRLIVPKLDRERPAYNIKESKIARILVRMLCLGQGDDRNNLMRAGGSSFPEVVYVVLRKHVSDFKSNLTIDELNESLDKIATRENDVGIEETMLQMFKKGSPQDVKWIVRMILKEMKLGIDANRILNAFHKDGAAFYAANSNLRQVCQVLWNSEVRLNEIEVNIYQAFHPMLSKQCNAETFKKEIIEGNLYLLENKFDGERFQLHMENGKFKYFSRRGFDYTDMYGETYENGILTPFLKDCFQDSVKKIILDGEMMLWNKNTKKFGSKGMNLDVKHLTSLGKYQPCFCVYDILLLNGTVLTNHPLISRLKTIRKVIKTTIEGTFMISKYIEVKSRKDIVDHLNHAVELEEEGIMIKDPKSVYKFGDRNGGWYKMKLEYFDDVVHDLDLLLMGVMLENKRIASCIVGVHSGNNDQGQVQYLSFGKVASGLSDLQLDMLEKKFQEKGKDFSTFSAQSKGCLLFGKETPSLWIEPEDSYTFVVRATELVRCTNSDFKTPYTLRFPRILKIRDDKPPEDCLSIDELLELSGQNKAVIKLNKGQLDLDEILKARPKLQRKGPKQIESTVYLKQGDADFLDGFKFFIYSTLPTASVNDIENSIRRAKGFVTVKMDDEVDVVLIDAVDQKLFEFIRKHNNFDFIMLDWLYRILDAKKVLPYKHEEIINLSDTENFMSESFDRFGDSFLEETTVESLKRTIHLMDQKDDPLSKKSKTWSFENQVAYFDTYEIINDDSSNEIYESFIDQMEFEFRNGIVSSTINPAVTMIIYGDPTRKKYLEEYKTEQNLECDIVERSFLYKN